MRESCDSTFEIRLINKHIKFILILMGRMVFCPYEIWERSDYSVGVEDSSTHIPSIANKSTKNTLLQTSIVFR